MKKELMLIIGLMGLLLSTRSIAEDITFKIDGYVTSVWDVDNLMLKNKIEVNMPFTGYYTYSTNTPDSYPNNPTEGAYWHYTSPYGISVIINELEFKTNPQDVKFFVGIANNWGDYSNDGYEIRSESNISLPNDKPVDFISWRLIDRTSGVALSNDFLPLLAPILDTWDDNWLYIHGGSTCAENFSINGTVTSVVLVPEPISLLMISAGGIFLMRKRSSQS